MLHILLRIVKQDKKKFEVSNRCFDNNIYNKLAIQNQDNETL